MAIVKDTNIIGEAVPRKEGRDKVTGRAHYVDDIRLPAMIYGATVRSSVARGRIRKITFGAGISWEEFTVVTAKDIPGKNCISLILEDQPCLAEESVNHPEEPILLLAHPDKYRLRKAVEAVSLEYEPLPALFSLEESDAKKEIIWGSDNIFKRYEIEKGDVDSIWAAATHIVEGEYFTGAQEQREIGSNGMIATYEGGRGVTAWGSLQWPYYVNRALMALLGASEQEVRRVKIETGGAFGGNEE